MLELVILLFVFADVDECLNESLHNCNKHAFCTNTIGNYTCTCRKNYYGDGMGDDGCNEKAAKDTKIIYILIGKYSCSYKSYVFMF